MNYKQTIMNKMQLLNRLMMVFALGAAVLFTSSCDEEDETDTCTIELDKDCFCTENPGDAQCEEEEVCDDFEADPECFCEANPDDALCTEPDGPNGLGVIIDFESGLESFASDFYNPSGLIEFDGDATISATEGDHYMSLVLPHTGLAADSANRQWHDFKYWPSAMDDDADNDNEAMIDFSEMDEPYLNMWVNSGAVEGDSLGFTVSFWGREDQAEKADHAIHPLFKTTTNGEWVLVSFSIAEMEGQIGWSGDPVKVDIDQKYTAIKFAFLPDYWHIQGNYTCHIDDISITDGPLTTE